LTISVEEAAEILKRASDIKKWLTDLEHLLTRSLFEKEHVPGWKLVEGRSNRKYVDEEKVVAAMVKAGYSEPDLFEAKLLGITAMEKEFGKRAVGEILGDLIYKPQGRPTLALENDKRPAFVPEKAIIDAFDETED